MKPKANYEKRKFGLLTVISCVEPSNGHNKGGVWMCKCKCRRFANFSGYQLHSRKSCGCLGRKAAVERGKLFKKSDEEKALGARYRQYKRTAIVLLEKQEWLEKIKQRCAICGDKELWMNHIELIPETNEPTCRRCNKMRCDITVEELTELVNKIYNNLSKKYPDDNSP